MVTEPTPNPRIAQLAKWNHASGVIPCTLCEGRGTVWNGKGLGGNDPESWDIDCPDCEGHGHEPCKVCGFDMVVAGYDCLVCDTVYALTDKDLSLVDPVAFTVAFAKALKAEAEFDENESAPFVDRVATGMVP